MGTSSPASANTWSRQPLRLLNCNMIWSNKHLIYQTYTESKAACQWPQGWCSLSFAGFSHAKSLRNRDKLCLWPVFAGSMQISMPHHATLIHSRRTHGGHHGDSAVLKLHGSSALERRHVSISSEPHRVPESLDQKYINIPRTSKTNCFNWYEVKHKAKSDLPTKA